MVDGQPIPSAAPASEYIALYKPRFVLSDNVSEDPRRTVFDLVPVSGHIFVVGRLDFESEGLILLTNDGELANQLTHPRFGHEKEYRVLVARRPDDEQIEVWRRGVVLEDGHKTSPADVRIDASAGKGAWLRIVMHEGRKRQIREICTMIGLPVVRIVRIRIGTVQVAGLKPGEWRNLTPYEIRELKAGPSASGERPPQRPRGYPKPRSDEKASPRTKPWSDQKPGTRNKPRPVGKPGPRAKPTAGERPGPQTKPSRPKK